MSKQYEDKLIGLAQQLSIEDIKTLTQFFNPNILMGQSVNPRAFEYRFSNWHILVHYKRLREEAEEQKREQDKLYDWMNNTVDELFWFISDKIDEYATNKHVRYTKPEIKALIAKHYAKRHRGGTI